MEDNIAKMFILGLMIMALWGIIAVFRSKSEGARRLRIVAYSLIALAVLGLIVHDLGVGGGLVFAAVVAVAIWVKRGFKPKN